MSGNDFVLTVNHECWRLQLVDVTRHASDWFIQFVALGPRAHTIFLRTTAAPTEGQAWRRLLDHVTEWLGQNDARRCAFIDLRGSL